MERSSNQIWKSTMTSGAILGIALVIYSILLYVGNLLMVKSLGYISYLIILGGIYYGIKSFRDNVQSGVISYGQALGVGVLTVAFAAFIASFFTYIQVKFIDPSMLDKILSLTQQQLAESGKSDAEIEMAMKITQKWITPGFMVISTIFAYVFIGTLFSLIVAAFMKKEGDPFAEVSNSTEEQ